MSLFRTQVLVTTTIATVKYLKPVILYDVGVRLSPLMSLFRTLGLVTTTIDTVKYLINDLQGSVGECVDPL